MALDGKVTVNQQAIARHPDIAFMAEKMAQRTHSRQPDAALGKWNEVDKSGNIGILGNGAGLLMATLDLVTEASQKKPGGCLNVGHGRNTDSCSPNFCDRVAQGLEFLSQEKNIQAILINILSSVPTTLEVAETIATFVLQHERHHPSKTRHDRYPHLVVRLVGSDLDLAKERLAQVQVPIVENLDEAVAQVIRLAKSSATRK